MTGVQEDSGQSQTTKELDESREVETIRKSRSTKEVDKMAEGGDIEQVIEDYFEVKKDEEDDKEEGSGKKPVPKVTMWLSWWKKQWTAANDLLSKVHQDKEKNPGAAPDKGGATYVSHHKVWVRRFPGNENQGQHCERYKRGESTYSVRIGRFRSFNINHFMGCCKESKHGNI